ncbi:MAG: UbiA prenyltransferase family protein [Planctomycetota bacterium]
MAAPKDFIKLARPHQWSKGAFILAGPFYGGAILNPEALLSTLLAVVAFSLCSSAVYVVNDIADREVDRHHPRKKNRPIASGRVSVFQAQLFAVSLVVGAALAVLLVPGTAAKARLGLVCVVYVANVLAYSAGLKRVGMLDAMSLSFGFVLRVLAGCVVTGVEPSTWLLNATLFIALFLGLGKRLGERRTLGDNADAARAVQKFYTDSLLRMAVVLAAVATLVVYAGYVQDQEARYKGSFLPFLDEPGSAWGLNLLWFSVLPATYGLLRAISLLERGEYDDPTVLATKDRGVQVAGALFVAITVLAKGPTYVREQRDGSASAGEQPAGALADAPVEVEHGAQ